MKVILTYDIKNGDNDDYKELYDYFYRVHAEELTESSYLINTLLKVNDFINYIYRLTKVGDKVKVILPSFVNGFEIYTIR